MHNALYFSCFVEFTANVRIDFIKRERERSKEREKNYSQHEINKVKYGVLSQQNTISEKRLNIGPRIK